LVDSVKTVKDAPQIFARNANPGVAYLEVGVTFGGSNVQFDFAVSGGVFDRIIQKVNDHLLQPGTIASNFYSRISLTPESNPFLYGEQAHLFGSRFGQFP
jgi:hypothetical protein